MTTITLATLAAISLANTPYPTTGPTLIPSLAIKYNITNLPIYILQRSSARCQPVGLNRLNPITALWTVEAGMEYQGLLLGIGHTSEHGIDRIQPSTESLDYVRAELVLKFG